MAKVELVSAEIKGNRTYKTTDSIEFTITLICHEPVTDDLEFEVSLLGDSYSSFYDQKLGHEVIGPIEPGKQYFQLKTKPLDLTKIPIKILFGMKSILIAGHYHKKQFIRIGYLVNIVYPGVNNDLLVENSNEAVEDQQDEEAAEDVEIMDDEELETEEEEKEEKSEEEEEEESKEEELVDEEEEETEEGDPDLEQAFISAFAPNQDTAPIPLETPIKEDVDDFEYKGIQMKVSEIEMSVLEKPIVHVYEINWGTPESVKENEIVESESSEEDVKKIKKSETL